jgi:glycyl-tRNA synthetase
MVISTEELASYCKRRGVVFPSSEIYGGIAGFYDYGPVGVEISKNIKKEWWNAIVQQNDNIVGMDGSIITSPKVWEASGHVKNFIDLLVECKRCNAQSRADHVVEDVLKKNIEGMKIEEINALIKQNKIKCPICKKGELGEVTKFNTMFQTTVGPGKGEIAYLRPETAQVIFSQFKNVLETSRLTLPFGIAQIGKAFRNEISPRNFLFRMREFEQMELEFFAHPNKKDECPDFDLLKDIKVSVLTAKAQSGDNKEEHMTIGDLYKNKIVKSKWHAYWIGYCYKWITGIGINPKNLRLREHKNEELSHYSSATVDIEYNYDIGWKELMGIADRTDFDLKQHSEYSKRDLSYFDEATKERVIPHVVAEPSCGVDRLFLTVITDAYHEEEIKGEKRIVLKLNPKLAAYQVAVFPLVNKEKMPEISRNVYKELKKHFSAFYDDSGSIGRRYRRQDEIGTPFCITIDGQTMADNTVTIRNRDTLNQDRIKISEINKILVEKLS